MTQDDAHRLLLVRDVSFANRQEDQFCTVEEFVLYNFTDEPYDQDIPEFERIVLRERGVYRLEVALGCAYDVSLC